MFLVKSISVIGAPYINSLITSAVSILYNIIFPSYAPETNVLPSLMSIIDTISPIWFWYTLFPNFYESDHTIIDPS